ncbi:unnamed protein product [Closterium sp. NIES-54]
MAADYLTKKLGKQKFEYCMLLTGQGHSRCPALPVAPPCPACRAALLAARCPAGCRAALPYPRVALLPATPPFAARAPPFAARRAALCSPRTALCSPRAAICNPRAALLLPALQRATLLPNALLPAPPCCAPPCCLRRPAAARPASRRPAASAPPCWQSHRPALPTRRHADRRPALPWLRATLP